MSKSLKFRPLCKPATQLAYYSYVHWETYYRVGHSYAV